MKVQRVQRNMLPVDRRQIIEMASRGMNDAAISRATTWSISTIFAVRKAAGISRRHLSPDPVPEADRQRMRELRAAGMSTMQIVAAVGWGQTAVRRITAGCAPPPKPKPAAVPKVVDDARVIIAPAAEDRWREALAGRQFAGFRVTPALGRTLAPLPAAHGLGRSSMAYA